MAKTLKFVRIGRQMLTTSSTRCRMPAFVENAPHSSSAASCESSGPAVCELAPSFGHYFGLPFIDASDAEIASQRDLRVVFDQSVGKLEFHNYVRRPLGRCYEAASDAVRELNGNGWATKVIGVLKYRTRNDHAPLNHYAVLANKNGVELVVDQAINQFSAFSTGEAFIGPLSTWESTFKALDKNAGKIVLYKKYDSLPHARSEIGNVAIVGFCNGTFFKEANYVILNMPTATTAKPMEGPFPTAPIVKTFKGLPWERG